MTAARVLALLAALHARAAPARLVALADAIAATGATDGEAVALVAIAFEESGLRPIAHEFGVMGPARPLGEAATAALRVYRAGLAACGSAEGAFFRFNAGRCAASTRRRSRAFRAAGRRALAYGRRCRAVVARLARVR